MSTRFHDREGIDVVPYTILRAGHTFEPFIGEFSHTCVEVERVDQFEKRYNGLFLSLAAQHPFVLVFVTNWSLMEGTDLKGNSIDHHSLVESYDTEYQVIWTRSKNIDPDDLAPSVCHNRHCIVGFGTFRQTERDFKLWSASLHLIHDHEIVSSRIRDEIMPEPMFGHTAATLTTVREDASGILIMHPHIEPPEVRRFSVDGREIVPWTILAGEQGLVPYHGELKLTFHPATHDEISSKFIALVEELSSLYPAFVAIIEPFALAHEDEDFGPATQEVLRWDTSGSKISLGWGLTKDLHRVFSGDLEDHSRDVVIAFGTPTQARETFEMWSKSARTLEHEYLSNRNLTEDPTREHFFGTMPITLCPTGEHLDGFLIFEPECPPAPT